VVGRHTAARPSRPHKRPTEEYGRFSVGGLRERRRGAVKERSGLHHQFLLAGKLRHAVYTEQKIYPLTTPEIRLIYTLLKRIQNSFDDTPDPGEADCDPGTFILSQCITSSFQLFFLI
jgi:hypothetical protein